MRPWAFGDVWDRMTPRQRRFAAWTDILGKPFPGFKEDGNGYKT